MGMGAVVTEERSLYDWPSEREWRKWPSAKRLAKAQELVEQADRQRSPVYEGDETPAQTKARTWLRRAKTEPVPEE